MRLYKTTYYDDAPDTGSANDVRAEWDGTQADAAKTRKRLKEEGMRNIGTDEFEVPTDKKGLLEFLNKWNVIQ